MAPATQPARVVAADLACADTLPKIEGMIMENTNDKTAVQMPEPDCAGDYCHNVLVYTVDETELIAATRAEEARREAEQRYKAKLGQFADDAFKAEQRARSLAAALDQRTAGGDAAQLPGLEFDGYHDSDEHHGKTILDLVRSRLEVDPDDLAEGDVLYVSAVWVQPQEWRVVRSGNPFEVERISPPDAQPVAEAAAQADDGERMSTDEARAYLIGFMKQHFTDKTYDRYILADRSSNGLAGDFAWQMANALRRIFAAPTAQPTLSKTVEFDGISPQPTPEARNAVDVELDAAARDERWRKTAQPTPPDDEPMTGATAPGWVAGRATPLDLLQRYGFDGTLGGDFDENADGPYVKLEDVRAALRQPGAPAKPLTRRDINFVKQPPGVIALTLAILWHDGAERPLYTRDDQIAWTGVDAGGHEKSVTVGQLREVLVAALGLPVGTKFGG